MNDTMNSRGDSDWDFAIVVQMKEAKHDGCPLQAEGCQHKVTPNTAKTIALQEGHQEAKTNEHHNVHILEHCTYRDTQISNET